MKTIIKIAKSGIGIVVELVFTPVFISSIHCIPHFMSLIGTSLVTLLNHTTTIWELAS